MVILLSLIIAVLVSGHRTLRTQASPLTGPRRSRVDPSKVWYCFNRTRTVIQTHLEKVEKKRGKKKRAHERQLAEWKRQEDEYWSDSRRLEWLPDGSLAPQLYDWQIWPPTFDENEDSSKD